MPSCLFLIFLLLTIHFLAILALILGFSHILLLLCARTVLFHNLHLIALVELIIETLVGHRLPTTNIAKNVVMSINCYRVDYYPLNSIVVANYCQIINYYAVMRRLILR